MHLISRIPTPHKPRRPKPLPGQAELARPAEEGARVESASTSPLELWAAAANVKEVCHKGPGGAEERNGTKHFRGGAKVYVIDAFWGMGDAVTVVGRHRKSRKWMCLHMPARQLENPRLTLVYSPAVLALMREHYAESGRKEPPGREYAEQICAFIPRWDAGPAEPGAAAAGEA